MAKTRAPKHRITQFKTEKEEFGENFHDKVKREMSPVFDLVGKSISVKVGNMTTPFRQVSEVKDTRHPELGRVLMLECVDGNPGIPLRIADIIESDDKGLDLIYVAKVSDDNETIFYATKSDKRSNYRERTIIRINVK